MLMKQIILKYALQNAVFYGGKAETGAVLGKVMIEIYQGLFHTMHYFLDAFLKCGYLV
jgi:hypothetical protein